MGHSAPTSTPAGPSILLVPGRPRASPSPSRAPGNFAQGIIELIGWARAVAVEQPRRFVMEATAAYHELAATRLHCAGLVVSVVNPAQVRALARGLGMLSKTDLIDALFLAQYARLAEPRQWRPTRPQLQEFSAMLMRLDCLESDLRREQNRRSQAAVRGSSGCVLSSIDACIDFLRGQCKAMSKAIDAHIVAKDAKSTVVKPGRHRRFQNSCVRYRDHLPRWRNTRCFPRRAPAVGRWPSGASSRRDTFSVRARV